MRENGKKQNKTTVNLNQTMQNCDEKIEKLLTKKKNELKREENLFDLWIYILNLENSQFHFRVLKSTSHFVKLNGMSHGIEFETNIAIVIQS